MSISLDTAEGIVGEATGPYARLTPLALEHAKSLLGITDLDALGAELGFSRQTFWRLRRGECDIRLSRAIAVAEKLRMPIHQVFDIPLYVVLNVPAQRWPR